MTVNRSDQIESKIHDAKFNEKSSQVSFTDLAGVRVVVNLTQASKKQLEGFKIDPAKATKLAAKILHYEEVLKESGHSQGLQDGDTIYNDGLFAKGKLVVKHEDSSSSIKKCKEVFGGIFRLIGDSPSIEKPKEETTGQATSPRVQNSGAGAAWEGSEEKRNLEELEERMKRKAESKALTREDLNTMEEYRKKFRLFANKNALSLESQRQIESRIQKYVDQHSMQISSTRVNPGARESSDGSSRCRKVSGSWIHDRHPKIRGVPILSSQDIANPSNAGVVFLFGDNYADKYRDASRNIQRGGTGGQAEAVLGRDRENAVGITTTFFNRINEFRDFSRFKDLMDREFEPLKNFVRRGGEVRFPISQNGILNVVDGSPKEYLKHNLGTGLGDVDLRFLAYIQVKIDELADIQVNQRNVVTTPIQNLQEMKKEIEENRRNEERSGPLPKVSQRRSASSDASERSSSLKAEKEEKTEKPQGAKSLFSSTRIPEIKKKLQDNDAYSTFSKTMKREGIEELYSIICSPESSDRYQAVNLLMDFATMDRFLDMKDLALDTLDQSKTLKALEEIVQGELIGSYGDSLVRVLIEMSSLNRGNASKTVNLLLTSLKRHLRFKPSSKHLQSIIHKLEAESLILPLPEDYKNEIRKEFERSR